MSELQIDNPTKNSVYNQKWTELKAHFIKVVLTFPKEYSIVNDNSENGKLTILNIPVSAEGKAISKDIILYITCDNVNETKPNVTLTVTNEDNKIASYNELERDKKALNIFSILVDKSINGTLGQSVNNAIKKAQPKVNTAQGIVQIISLIVALIAIFYALSVLMK